MMREEEDRLVKIALLQMPSADETETNLETAKKYVREAAERGAQILVLPEMFVCLYTNRSFVDHQEPAGGRIWNALKDMAAENRVWLVGGSMPESDGDRIYNTCFIFDPEGREAGRHRKVHLFDIDVKGGQSFKESRTFTAGDEFTVIDTPYGKIGVGICFDIRFPEQVRAMALKGAEMVFMPASFNMTTGPRHWELLFKARAVDNQVFMFGCSPARDPEGPYVSYGHSIAVSPWGEVIGQAEDKPQILMTEIDLREVEEVREQLPLLSARRTDLYS